MGRAGQGVLHLNQKEEYNRYLLHKITMEGPRSLREQEEQDMNEDRVTITLEQE